jgi:hypothetical protein
LIDESLREYATEKQWQYYEAYCAAGSYRKAAAALGLTDESVVRKGVKALQEAALRAGKVPAGYKVDKVTTVTDKDGRRKLQSVKVGVDDVAPQNVVTFPGTIKRTTTLRRGDDVVLQWERKDAEDVWREKMWRGLAKELGRDIIRAVPEPIPLIANKRLMSVYAVGDQHTGMLSWGKETGSSWDLEIAERTIKSGSDYLIGKCPSSDVGLLLFLGDFMHYDGWRQVTPTSEHEVDADGRFPKMWWTAKRALRYMVAAALRKHRHVHIIFEIGNHDLTLSWLMADMLATIYEDEPRVTVDISPGHYHYYRFGKVLIGSHHGHGTKPDNLGMIMAADRPQDWGETEHRHWFTGHIHTHYAKDLIGCTWESMRVLPPNDAWAHQKGYRSIRGMSSIVYDIEQGEIERYSFKPSMLAAQQEAMRIAA